MLTMLFGGGALAMIFFWLMLSIAVGILANRYNRIGIGWLLFSVLLSPLLGFAFVLSLGSKPARMSRITVD